jgi:hypothetical protein
VILTEHAFDVSKDGGVMNEIVEAPDAPLETAPEATSRPDTTPASDSSPIDSASSPAPSVEANATDSASPSPESTANAVDANELRPNDSSVSDPGTSSAPVDSAVPSDSTATNSATSNSMSSNSASGESESPSATPMDQADSSSKYVDGMKKTRAPRTPKAPGKPVEAGGSITTIVERVVRMTTLSDEHAAALGRLFNVSLPEDYVARLTRLTGASLGPIGSGAAEALSIVLGLESANPIHVGVQLGRLAATSLPDVYRCAHALTGETAPALPKGDNAVFAVADVLATLTTDDFALARALSSALE